MILDNFYNKFFEVGIVLFDFIYGVGLDFLFLGVY